MTRPEADELFREYARSRDHAVMARLVEENLPLSQAVARKFQGRGVEKDDLEQVAAMALMQAIERFDPERGLQFSTFALPTIAGSVRNYLRVENGKLVSPGRMQYDLMAINKDRFLRLDTLKTVSYTHLTLPTNSRV